MITKQKDDGLNVINDYLKKLGLINSKGKIKMKIFLFHHKQ